ncbi:hypothetical protein COV03_02890 [Candidatus Uhrbacteria bacterium CG10_big_fil_rev_8_21_14_0_10_41_26]|nr:MAG: hypothetical protein COZ45_03890 [Candidatus Uhrbacteria bacterium CG_4_10_14_3_um_filter_41_21]PIZ55292.1 MAG: hypothetical protein COY24_00830 [Candidatus Uhrbacteria bacterium CG_4_10_14_0_2_um_filter_41_21]PJB84531.1 MAG: hypothetical protein CO086_03000 [Candidatus Uhrbacteria bacterium CG_4_9_14_0_8_um_filter_41_16]PJE74896.1 MAG: hypothetical protein COV03_02890 [Candidatus Uhrbacteria bacterium CG10_big_fil_rev_8_21_14_0_10_41_26]
MSKKQTFFVEGTHCASCEVVIERSLKEIKGVQSVQASHGSGKVVIKMDDSAQVNQVEINEKLSPHGYLIVGTEDSQKSKKKFSWQDVGAYLVLIISVYIIFKNLGILTFSPAVEGASGLLAVFVIGLVAAFSSCTAVIGGLVVALSASAAKAQTKMTFAKKIRPHILFNTGRIIGFIAFGALIGLLGQAITLTGPASGVFIFLVALLMIGLGIHLLEIFPKGLFVISPPKWLSHKIHNLQNSEHPAVPFILGALTFFLPCGFTQSMQLYAMSLGDPLSAALVMGVFALGTVPALFGIGAATVSAKKKSLSSFTKIAGVIVIVLGISNAGNGMTLLGISPSFSFQTSAKTEQIAPSVVGGEQVVKMRVLSRGAYSPDELTVVKGVPVRWEITGDEFLGCANSLILRQFGVSERISTGLNIVKFTPTKTGSFTFSCSMGMIRGTMTVIENES